MRRASGLTCMTTCAVLASLLSGCGGQPAVEPEDSSPAGPSQDARATPEDSAGPTDQPLAEIEILCGTSFGPPMEKLVEEYEKETGNRAVLVFGGSEDHLPKVKLKAAGDVYVTHTPYMRYTEEAGALLRRVDVGFLAPVLVVQPGNPHGLQRFEDLAKPGLGVVLPNPEFSTCGEMIFKLLEKKQIKDAVLENVGNAMVKHHATVGNQMKVGARDAGIMWNGVAHNFRDAVQIVPLPYEYDEEIRVAVMGLSYTEKPDAVQRFLDFVEQHGKETFAQFGYVKVAEAAGP